MGISLTEDAIHLVEEVEDSYSGGEYYYNHARFLRGVIDFNYGEYDQAISIFKSLLQMKIEDIDQVLILNNLAACYLDTDRLDSAEYYLKETLKFDSEVSAVYSNLALIASYQKDSTKFFHNIKKAIEFSSPNDYNVLRTSSIFYLQKSDFKNGIFYLKEAYKNTPEKDFVNKLNIAQNLNNYYLNEKKDTILAYKYFELATQMQDSLHAYELQIEIDKNRVKERVIEMRSTIKEQSTNLQISILITTVVVLVILIVLVLLVTVRRKNKALSRANQTILEDKETIEELNKDLNSNNKELLEIDNQRNKLYRIVSHDLKNPFLGITLSIDTLITFMEKDQIKNEKLERIIRRLKESSEMFEKLLLSLLEWAQFSSTKAEEIEKSVFPIVPLIEDVIKVYEPLAETKNLNIELTVLEEMGNEVLCNEESMSTIIRNLLNNAVKFTPDDKSIFIRVKNSEDKVFLEFEDEGIGMSESQIESIKNFEKLTSTADTSGVKSTGFGLMFFIESCKKNNITFNIQSEKDKGTKFSLTIPKSGNLF